MWQGVKGASNVCSQQLSAERAECSKCALPSSSVGLGGGGVGKDEVGRGVTRNGRANKDEERLSGSPRVKSASDK